MLLRACFCKDAYRKREVEREGRREGAWGNWERVRGGGRESCSQGLRNSESLGVGVRDGALVGAGC